VRPDGTSILVSTGGLIRAGTILTATNQSGGTVNATTGNFSGIVSFSSNVVVSGNLIVSTGNTSGGGIILSDDGDIVDLNTGFMGVRFSSGLNVHSAARGGTVVISLTNGGAITATNNITAFFSSDKKFKENIQDIPDALDKVNAIGGKLFDWTDDYIKNNGGADGYFLTKSSFGVIAQDVQAVFPQAVRKRPDDSLAVDYEKLCALAFSAIKELSDKVAKLEGK